MTNPERNQAPAVKYRVGSLGELCLVSDIRDEEHLYDLRTLTGVEWYDAAGNWTEPPAILPDGSGLASAKAAAAPAPAEEPGGYDGPCPKCGAKTQFATATGEHGAGLARVCMSKTCDWRSIPTPAA